MSSEVSQPEGLQPEASPKTSPAAGLAAVVIGWVDAHRLYAGLIGGACLLLIGGLVVGLTLLRQPNFEDISLDAALAALDVRAYEDARHIAKGLRAEGLPSEVALGAPAFILGASAAYEADERWSSRPRELHLVAARYLEEARDLGFPAGREGEGLFLLARSLFRSGQLAECRPILRDALSAHPVESAEIHWLLAGAYLHDASPKLVEALAENAAHLSDPTLSSEDRQRGLLQRAEVLLRMRRQPDALAALDEIPENAKRYPEAIVMRGRILLAEARALKRAPEPSDETRQAANAKLDAAIKTLRLARGRDTLAARATRKAMYLIGLCYRERGDDRAALSQFGRTRRTFVGTPEALATDFQIADIFRRTGRDDKALAAYRRVLEAVGDPGQYQNPWLTLDDLRAGVLVAYEDYRDREAFEVCLKLTKWLSPVFSRARRTELVAETRKLWGRRLLDRASDARGDEANSLRRDGRLELRRAGVAYEQLARDRLVTRHHPDDLWESAQSYLRGHAFEKAVDVLKKYMKVQTRRRHPRALVSLGEAYMATGQLDEAIQAFDECVEFYPRDVAAFRARIAASHAHHEKGNIERAEAVLKENLEGEFLSPSSAEWRDSLFDLGHLYHMVGRYEETTKILEEAVARYPDVAQAAESRYLMADAFRRRAAAVKAQFTADLLEVTRTAASRTIAQYHRSALSQYQQARETLAKRELVGELSPLEKRVLRNCDFSIGGVLFDLKQYDEAIRAYSAAAQRYENTPEALEAHLQLVRIHGQLGQPADARLVLEQAKATLARMEETTRFEQTTIRTRKQWAETLDWLGSL